MIEYRREIRSTSIILSMTLILSLNFLISFSNLSYGEAYIPFACSDNELDANCIAEGRIKTIYLYNFITVEDLNAIAYIAGQLPIQRSFPKIVVNVDGGNLDAAIGIGRILRWRRAMIETLDAENINLQPKCYSACVVVAAGAVQRNLTMIGIHTGYLKTDAEGIDGYQPIPNESKARLREYYNEMGVSEEMQVIEDATPFWEMSYFFYNPNIPFEKQKIVQWGFRQLP